MKQGTVKFFNETKGFGFISPKDGSKDIFVHKSNLIDSIRENDEVQFETETSPKGPSAVQVEKI